MDAVPKPDKPIHTSVIAAAEYYIERGLQVVPLAEGTKACLEKDWLKLIFTPQDFKPNDNIGIRSVNGLVDIDCDSPEVVAMAPDFLPKTGAVYGRVSKPTAHWLYKSEFDKRIVFMDLFVSDEKKATLIEIRVNHQSMAPPSIHPDKEVIEWQFGGFNQIYEVLPEVLLRSVQLLATAALVGRHYNPEGNRHDWCLALAGFFRQLGLSHDEARRVMIGAAGWARDLKIQDRLGEINSTYNHGEDDPLKSGGALKELMDKGALFAKTLNKIWGASSLAFRVDKKGEHVVANDQNNIRLALKKLNVELSFNDFKQQQWIKYKEHNEPLRTIVANKVWLHVDKAFHFRPSKEFFEDVIADIAFETRTHPIKEYLLDVKWDKVPRLNTWLIRHARAANNPYVQSISAIVLIAAVRRIFIPGCKYDELLVLESGQGQLKSSALRTLCPDEEWFSDDLPLNLDAKEIIERTNGKWIIEAAELSGMNKWQTEHLKAMLSRQEDGPVRMAYDRHSINQRRQFIIVGTTNSHAYLHDPTGNRRFWPLRIEEFNIGELRKERDQLWAEAVERERAGESIRLESKLWPMATLQQERRVLDDSWETVLASRFDQTPSRVTNDEIWEALGIPIIHQNPTAQLRIYQIMQKLGFKKMSVIDRKTKKVTKGWGKGKWIRGRKLYADDKSNSTIAEDIMDDM